MLARYALYFAWVIALLATLGSLYYSEIMGVMPCNLCWYQRIALFPLVVLLGIAAYREDTEIDRYLYPLLGIGLFFAVFHTIYLYTDPWGSELCGTTSCVKDREFLLNVPLPFWSIAVFLSIGFLLLYRRKITNKPRRG